MIDVNGLVSSLLCVLSSIETNSTCARLKSVSE
jgi:hypothetical protein